MAPARHPFSKAALLGTGEQGGPWRRAAVAFLGSRHPSPNPNPNSEP
jgi:hypothetical protein